MNDALQSLKARALEQAFVDTEAGQFDTSKMSMEDLVTTASMLRMQRLVDAEYLQIESDHLSNMTSRHGLDRAMDVYDAEYLLDLPISYQKLMQLCRVFLSKCEQHQIRPLGTWQDFASGNFPFEREIEKTGS